MQYTQLKPYSIQQRETSNILMQDKSKYIFQLPKKYLDVQQIMQFYLITEYVRFYFLCV